MMLNNKAIVDSMLENEIGNSAKQFVDTYDRVFEITQKKQSKVMGNVQKAMEKLKIVQTMANPQEVNNYLTQMTKLRPMLDSLITEIEDLNKFENAVNIQVSDVTKIKQFMDEIGSLQSLFEATSGYYKHINEFFESRRTLVNVETTGKFIEQFTVQLSIFESSLTTHRAAKHFIAYARNEVDGFKKNFAVAEVMSCRRLLDAHWLRMSEIVGFDLTPYANSSIAQICELGLEAHLQQLKPIAFSAEREATAADQLHEIVTFWSHEPLETKFYAQWKFSLAVKLFDLHIKLQNDIHTLRHMTNVEQITDDSLPQWIDWTCRTEDILRAWCETQQKWMRVANIFVTCRDTLQKEYELLRTCAKYWIKIEKNIRKETTVYRFIQLPHLPCWLEKIKSMVTVIIGGVRSLLDKMRMNNARLCLSSELHLLSLFSATSVDVRNQLEMVDLNGEKITVDLAKSEIENQDPCELIKSIETAFAAKLTDEKSFHLQHKTTQRQSLITVDFVYSTETSKFVPRSLADNWSTGHLILMIGEVCTTRSFALKLANCLCSNLRIVNSHDLLEPDFLHRLTNCVSMVNWFVLLENVDLLSPKIMFQLFNMLSFHVQPFPRLFISCTEDVKIQLPATIAVERLKPFEDTEDHKIVVSKFDLPPASPISSVRSSSIPTPTRLPALSQPAPPSSPHSVLLEKIGTKIRNREISGCVGPMAKSTLKEALIGFPENVIWIYVDVFVRDQLVVRTDEFAATPTGLLFEILSPNGPSVGGGEDSERSYHSTVSTSSGYCVFHRLAT
uniref:DHC_N2 domain-containing protein n=1 Tax=Caenorhabditis japonica TaxID=281687 RepID=A0A8R1EKU9_CAEJA